MLTGRDGQKGACKDMVDLVRYAVMSDIWEWTAPGSAKSKVERSKDESSSGFPPPTRRAAHLPRKSRVWW